MDSTVDPAAIRARTRLINDRVNYLSGVLSNGGLAMVAGGIGLFWVEGSKAVNGLVVIGGVIVILIGLGLLDFLRSED